MARVFIIGGRVILGFGAIILFLALVLHFAIAAAALWLKSPQGEGWIKRQIAQALAGSGYTVAYDDLSYDLGGITVTGLRVQDGQGPVAEADEVSASLNFTPLTARHASISVNAGHVVWHRIPEGAEEAGGEPPSGFEVPELFFDTFALDPLSIKQLEIREQVFGQELALEPSLRAKVALVETIEISVSGRTRARNDKNPVWMPETFAAEAELNPQTMEAALRNLSVKAKPYNLEGSGKANFGKNGKLDLTLNGNADLAAFLAGQPGQAEIAARITGPLDAPVLALNGTLAARTLAEKGISDFAFTAEARDLTQAPAGSFELSALYQDMPVTLASEFAYSAPSLGLSGLHLTAPDLTGAGDLAIDTTTMLVQGNTRLKFSNLQTYAELFGQNIAGAGSADLSFAETDGNVQSAVVDIALRDARYDDYAVAQANIKASFPVIDNPWPQELELTLQGGQVGDRLTIGRLTAAIGKVQGNDYRLTIDGEGALPHPFSISGSAGLTGLAGKAPAANDIQLSLSSRGSSIAVTGSANTQRVDLALNTQSFALANLPVAIPEALKNTSISGTASVTGPLATPEITASLSTSPLAAFESGPALKLAIEASLREGVLRSDVNGSGTGVETFQGHAVLPLAFSLQPFVFNLPSAEPVTGALQMNLDGEVLAGAILPPDHLLSGTVHASAALGGTLAEPAIEGTVSMKGAEYAYPPYEIRIEDIDLAAEFTPDTLSITRFSGNDGAGGVISGSGAIGMRDASATQLDITASDFHLLRSNLADALVRAELAVTGSRAGYNVNGDIWIDRGEIVIPERFTSDIPQLNIVEAKGEDTGSEALQTFALDVRLHAPEPRGIFVRGWGLDAELAGSIDVTGTLDEPRLDGTLELVRGIYEEFGRRFRLAHANLRFQGRVPPSPFLDVEAVTDTGEIEASVLLTGTVDKPELGFSSDPALPQDEILAHIMFGRDMSRLTPFQAVQLAQTLQRFSGRGGGSFDPLGQLRDITGFDEIRVETEESGETSVGVGKYLSDKVYLEVERGRGEASGSANIEIELTPNISVESRIGQDAQSGAGLFWSRDY